MQVKAWSEVVTIPTYKLGEPDKNPMFLEKRVYQGSSGAVYPHPVIDKVFDQKENKEWIALFLENEYLKIMILPELGGRIQMAYDKTNDYHFIYYNTVIKPALVGLAGPWISGGIEFNWPQHHRPSTFDPIDYSIEENADGSKTVWVNEYEKMFRTKCALGFTLYPGKAYIELHAKLFNRTPFPQTFLWWANPAVAVDEHYQSVFPPDVNAVFDHGKRDVSTFPIAKGTYYKVDYSPGTDISVYTNIPVPTSYMAVNSEFNFVGGYHHQKKAGMLHVANHHVSPGKKQWTWGSGEFGKAWDKHLTDADGPYFELMCGMFTDNQPDFSWIMPNEVREFRQYFMPYKNIGHVKNASVKAMVNFEIKEATACVGVYVTEKKDVTIVVRNNSEIIFSSKVSLSPTATFSEQIKLESRALAADNYTVDVMDEDGNILISYSPVSKKDDAIPDPAKAIPEPSAIETTEELYLAGLHLEQYRHATYAAEDYYQEAVNRDPSDIRNNNALGLLYLRKGIYDKSEQHFRKAVDKLTKHNPNPFDGEPLYNLGLSLKYQFRYSEAYRSFYKSAWNAAMQDNAYLQLAYIDCILQNWDEALSHVETSLIRNYHSPKARHLKAVILRKLNHWEKAAEWINESLRTDSFDFGSRFELHRIYTNKGEVELACKTLDELKQIMRDDNHSYTEISLDYANTGMYDEAFELLSQIADQKSDALTHYYMGYYTWMRGDKETAAKWFQSGFQCSPDKIFPNRIEDIEVLKKVIEVNPGDYKAYYYSGNFFYAKRRYEDARAHWEKSVAINEHFPTTHRNLGIAYFNKFNQKEKALASFEMAFKCDTKDSRVLLELDQLRKRFRKSTEERLRTLERFKQLVEERDDLYTEYINLYALTGRYEEALELLKNRNFHPWEGGEGKVSELYIQLNIELTKLALKDNRINDALTLLHCAQVYPDNLGEGKLYGAQENDIHYWMGCAYEQQNDIVKANKYWTKASVGLDEPSLAIFYNDQQPDKIYYQGAALLKLGRNEEAFARFNNLIRYGLNNAGREIKMDFFAVSLPDLMIFDDDLSIRNNIHCYYLVALGHLGLRQYNEAENYFKKVLDLEPAHLGAVIHKSMLDKVKGDVVNIQV